MLRARRFTPLRHLSCVTLSVIGALALVAAAHAQSTPEAPQQSQAPQAQGDPSQAQANPQSDASPSSEQKTAENAETDCGCPKADPAAAQTVSEATKIIEANLTSPEAICGLITPLVSANPCAAPDVIAAAGAHPEIAEKLAQCLSTIQKGLKKKTPEAAATVEKVVACAPPAFQAAYSESLAPDGGDSTTPGTDGPTGANATPPGTGPGPTGPTGGTGGNGGFNPTSPIGTLSRFGGGPIVPQSFGGGSVSPF